MPIPLRFLILEDQPADAELMLRSLRHAGFDPTWQRVETEADYLAQLERVLDLILADYHLPAFDALRALQHLQARGLDIPFIVVSDTIGEGEAALCMRRGATDYVPKDQLARLGSAVAHALDQRRLRAEQAQREQWLRLQSAALEAAANGIVITDREGTILWVNPAYTRLTGYGAEEAIGQNPRILKSGKHDLAFYQKLWETILSGQVWRGETINKRKDGSLYTEEQTITPVWDERGVISHFIAIKEDITQRKRAEEELRESALQLEATVEDRTHELQVANSHLEKVSRHKSEFLTNMSHELRTPLNSILGFSELLKDETYGPMSAKQARYVGHIHQSGQHLLSLINDLLDLSKVEAGRLELRPEPIALPEALAAALDEIRPLADVKRLTLTLRAEQAPVTLHADPVRFKQILYNLLSNAVKFTPEGGQITVTAKLVRGAVCAPHSPGSRIDLGTSKIDLGGAGRGVRGAEANHCPSPLAGEGEGEGVRSAECVEIAVTDTGIGIKADDLSKLFQSFVQLEPALAKPLHGTGLGLALTKHLVELHGGSIAATSAGAGQGSTFSVRLPLTPPPPDGSPAEGGSYRANHGR